MNGNKVLTKYLFPVMMQIIIIALIAVVFNNIGIKLGYESVIGIILIVLSGVSSALWGVLYQCRYNAKCFWEIMKDLASDTAVSEGTCIWRNRRNWVEIYLPTGY